MDEYNKVAPADAPRSAAKPAASAARFDLAEPLPESATSPQAPQVHAFAIDLLLASREGWLLIEGWIDDSFDPILEVRISGSATASLPGRSLGRLPQNATGLAAAQRDIPGLPRFIGLIKALGLSEVASGDFVVTMIMKSGRAGSVPMGGQIAQPDIIRARYLASLPAVGGGADRILPFLHLEHGSGDTLLTLNEEIVAAFCSAPFVMRYGRQAEGFEASIIVCIYGRAEYLFLQAALFSSPKVQQDFEFIYVCNSPELGDIMMSEAAMAASMYNLSITIILLGGNAGFAAANNIAAEHARSDRLIFMNPDVFPRDVDWAEKHAAIIADRPPAETTVFGAALYYEDGSLMHGGMHIAEDDGVTFSEGRTLHWRLSRVEHFGKGAPPDTPEFTAARAVPAITGAFLSTTKQWFNALAGFGQDYVLGHYEDADFCLRSTRAGARPWLQGLSLWHLEGQGSPKQPENVGSALLNRWVFSAKWASNPKAPMGMDASGASTPTTPGVQ